jgi:hypothetical protein
LSIVVDVEETFGGFAFSIQSSDLESRFGEVALGRDLENYLLSSSNSDGKIRVAGCAQNSIDMPSGKIELIRIPIESDNQLSIDDFYIQSYDFSDGFGNMIDADFEIKLERSISRNRQSETRKLSIAPKAYPNPFNSQVLISFTASQPGLVSVEIFDILGRKVKTLIDNFNQPGQHQLTWHGENESGSEVSAGIYLCRIQTSGEEKVVKLQYLK